MPNPKTHFVVSRSDFYHDGIRHISFGLPRKATTRSCSPEPSTDIILRNMNALQARISLGAYYCKNLQINQCMNGGVTPACTYTVFGQSPLVTLPAPYG